jgi:hypothetical protein
MAIASKVKNAGELYITGAKLSFVSTTSVAVAAGQARDSTNVNDIELLSAVTIDAAVVGAGGIDKGALANNTMYAVYMIGSSYGNEESSAILSADLSAPFLPGNYDMSRRVGMVLTNGGAEILEFLQTGSGKDREMTYDVIKLLAFAATSDTFAAVDCSAYVPAMSTMLHLSVNFTPDAASDSVVVRPTGSSSTLGYSSISGDVASVLVYGDFRVPCNSAASIDYKVSTNSSLTLFLRGYVDEL